MFDLIAKDRPCWAVYRCLYYQNNKGNNLLPQLTLLFFYVFNSNSIMHFSVLRGNKNKYQFFFL